uniref:MHD domain-containing protein n=1 Tax=Mola mola TaxID=94237 RepID=A0A3Q3VYQ7_MOLML
MMQGLKKRTRKAFGIRKKEKDNDSTGSPDRDGGSSSAEYTVQSLSTGILIKLSLCFQSQKKTNGAPNGFYGDIDWDRYNSPEVDDEGYSIRPDEEKSPFFSSDESEEEEDHRNRFKIKIKPLPADREVAVPSVDELKASIGNIALSPSPLVKPLCRLISEASTEADGSTRKPSIADLDNIFGPENVPPAGEDKGDCWICFSEESTDRPLPGEPAPLLPNSPPPPESPAPPLSTLPPPQEDPTPPLPTSQEDPVLPVPTPPPPSEEPASPPVTSGPPTPEDRKPHTPPTSLPSAQPNLASPPTSSPLPLESPASVQSVPAPKARTPPEVTPPAEEPGMRPVPPPLILSQEEPFKNADGSQPKEDSGETVTSPKEANHGSRSTPPPPPPPAYQAVVSSPGPGTNSGDLFLLVCSPSLLNLPLFFLSGQNRPFSPPVHSASPPPIAPLARAESTSSISSTNSMIAATTPTVENDQPSLVWFDRGKFYLTFEGCSRGPSPLTMGAQDTLPVAAAFTETVNAFFKGADPSKCVVKIIGEMVLSFPAGITRHFANNPSPAVLTFSITNYSRLEHVLPNPQLLCCDTTTKAKADSKDFWVNMPNLIAHLKKVAEQKPQATYYNVDMLKYQVSTDGLQSIPLSLVVSWRCEPTSTDLRIDYKYNGEAMTMPTALNNVQFLVPVDGGVSKLQAVLPPAAWNAEQQRILWKIPDISQKSETGGVGSLLARFQLTEGPGKPAPLAVQFTSEGSTLSGCDIELAGPGYRFSLIKKRFAAGQFRNGNKLCQPEPA